MTQKIEDINDNLLLTEPCSNGQDVCISNRYAKAEATKSVDVSSIVKNMTNLMSTTSTIPDDKDSEKTDKDTNKKTHENHSMAMSPETVDIVSKNSSQRITEEKHDSSIHRQTVERHVSTSEDEPTGNKMKSIGGERSHEGKRIPPPKNVQPVIQGK